MSVDRPEANRDYPGTYGDLLAWFRTDAACLEYLEWLRWPDGFSCPRPWRAGRDPGEAAR
jgi:hypothetical protein